MIWETMTEIGTKDVQPGTIGLIIGAITGLPSMTWSAIQGDFLPAYAGSATGIAGFLFWVYKQPEDRRTKMLTDSLAALTLEFSGVRDELKEARRLAEIARKAAEEAEVKAIEDRTSLRLENENLRVQLARVGAGVKRVESIVANPTITPDPDQAKGIT